MGETTNGVGKNGLGGDRRYGEAPGGATTRVGDRRGEVGRLGEVLAAEFLLSRGCRVLDANWRCARGELDLVVVDPDRVLRFVEVRSRSGHGFGTGAESVTADKRRRLRRLAALWLAAHHGDREWSRVVFDVVSVDLSTPELPLLDWIAEAF